MKNNIARRNFIKNTLLITGGLLLAPIVESCQTDDQIYDIKAPDGMITSNFDSGIASFDPTATSIILWTRYAFVTEIVWEIATDVTFSNKVRQGTMIPNEANDYCVAVEVKNLTSNTKFYYRFYNVLTKETSPTGQTITLPATTDAVTDVKLAVVSCSNYPAGLFNVYKATAQSDAQVVLHLGDYIYEYAPGEYGTNANTTKLNRAHKPAKELLTLTDYRERYKQYRSDKNLQLAHQLKPFICVWDDHEIANDAYTTGADNHQPNEGPFEARKNAALQAHSEYIPLKTGKDKRIYRTFDFGSIASLHMLDTRVIARDKPLDYVNYFTAQGEFKQEAFKTDLYKQDRNLLGLEQIQWLQQKITTSGAKWQILGQQVLMTKMLLPAELLVSINTIQAQISALGSIKEQTMLSFQKTLMELLALKGRKLQNDPTLTPYDLARINTVLPYNLDAWDGYPIEREYLYTTLKGKNIISFAGDTHNGWYGKLTDYNGKTVGVELATPSVTSPGLESYLGISSPAQAKQLAEAFALLIDDLEYGNLNNRGYLYIHFTQGAAQAQWRYVDTIEFENFAVSIEKTVAI